MLRNISRDYGSSDNPIDNILEDNASSVNVEMTKDEISTLYQKLESQQNMEWKLDSSEEWSKA